MNDTAQIGLREPEQVDWDNYNTGGSSYSAPPPAIGPNGKPITYFGRVKSYEQAEPDQGYLNFLFDPIVIERSGTHDGYTIRFTRASARPFTKLNKATGEREPIKGNPNALANFLRASGLTVKPQTNAEYIAAVKAAVARPFAFTLDWEAYNKDTGERVKGYLAFPEDPERPGQRKSILHAGDVVSEVDAKGNVLGVKKVESEVLFANARLKFFQDPKK